MVKGKADPQFCYKKLYRWENAVPEEDNIMHGYNIFNIRESGNKHFSYLSRAAAISKWRWDRDIDFLRGPTLLDDVADDKEADIRTDTLVGHRVHMRVKKIPISDEIYGIVNEINAILPELVHPLILPFFGIGEKDHQFWIVWEYFEGKSMREIINSRKRDTRDSASAGLPEEVIALIASHVLNALVYLHKQKVAHGTIKADNLVLSKKGQFRLAGHWQRKYYPKLGLPLKYLCDVQTSTGEILDRDTYTKLSDPESKIINSEFEKPHDRTITPWQRDNLVTFEDDILTPPGELTSQDDENTEIDDLKTLTNEVEGSLSETSSPRKTPEGADTGNSDQALIVRHRKSGIKSPGMSSHEVSDEAAEMSFHSPQLLRQEKKRLFFGGDF